MSDKDEKDKQPDDRKPSERIQAAFEKTHHRDPATGELFREIGRILDELEESKASKAFVMALGS